MESQINGISLSVMPHASSFALSNWKFPFLIPLHKYSMHRGPSLLFERSISYTPGLRPLRICKELFLLNLLFDIFTTLALICLSPSPKALAYLVPHIYVLTLITSSFPFQRTNPFPLGSKLAFSHPDK